MATRAVSKAGGSLEAAEVVAVVGTILVPWAIATQVLSADLSGRHTSVVGE